MSKTPFEELLDKSGIKKKVIAEKMGLTRSGFYQKCKNPKKKFDGDEMVKLAKILGIEPKKVLEAILIS